MKTLVSWNVNGIRAIEKKGFFQWLNQSGADIVALQESKAHPDQLSDAFIHPEGYHSYWASAEKKGYSGTVLYSKEEPLKVHFLGDPAFDSEGRVLVAEYRDFYLINAYFPNSQAGGKRLPYKLDFCAAIKDYCSTLAREGKNVLLCGDYNIAHQAIDLARPENNEKNPGYLPEERQWMTSFLEGGFCDCFRQMHPEARDAYSWWSYRTRARERNVGWRIDYHCVNQAFTASVKEAFISPEITGSDHCPVNLRLI